MSLSQCFAVIFSLFISSMSFKVIIIVKEFMFLGINIFWPANINSIVILGRYSLIITDYYHFVGHYGASCGLIWRIWRTKMYFSPLK